MLTLQDRIHHRQAYPGALSQRLFAYARSSIRIGSDGSDLSLGQFRSTGLLTLQSNVATLGDHVRDVIGLTAFEQMAPVAAWRIVAGVQHFLGRSQWADLEAVRHSVSAFKLAAADADDAVAIVVTEARPRPTGIRPTGLVHSRPKPRLQRFTRLSKRAAFAGAESPVASLDLIRASFEGGGTGFTFAVDQVRGCISHADIMPYCHARWNRQAWEFLREYEAQPR